MQFDSDVALLGTGIAPLIAASRLMAEGRRVLLLNPDDDFFQEDSELPLDPLFPLGASSLSPQRLLLSTPQKSREILSPLFPGSLESWPVTERSEGFRDPSAPFLRARSRLLLFSPAVSDLLEAMYVESSDAGLNPRIAEGISATSKFPGISSRSPSEGERAVVLPRICDVDVNRYRNGVLEYLREIQGSDRVLTGVSNIELSPEGVRFYAEGAAHNARLSLGLWVFWTPRLSSWVLSSARALEARVPLPEGIRMWEQWSFFSRENLDPRTIGHFEDMTVWADVEGIPDERVGVRRLSVLRPGALLESPALGALEESRWASVDSFAALSRLFHEFLRWDRFSVSALKTRAIYEWGSRVESDAVFPLGGASPRVWVFPRCDGPLIDVVASARRRTDLFLERGLA